MVVSFFYGLGLLIIIPHIMGWEALGILGLIGGSLFAWLVIWVCGTINSFKAQDEEYIGTYVKEARYFTEWTERIRHEDKNTKKVTYETVEHPAEWEIVVDEDPTPLYISHGAYIGYVETFGNEYHTQAEHSFEARGEIINPGLCYYTTWPGTYQTLCYHYIEQDYYNPTLQAPNMFEVAQLSEEDVKKYHLQAYSPREIYGTVRGEDVENLEIETEDYNCWFRTKHIKLNFILLENAPTSLALYWQQYWKNGKRNTVNVVISVDSRHNIQWVHVFGWQNERLHVKLRDFLVGLNNINDIVNHFEEVKQLLETEYHCADFEQYDYIRPRFPLKNTIIVLTICLGLFCGLFCREPDPPIDAMRLISKREFAAAKEILEPYVFTKPEDAYSYNNLGLIYLVEGNYEEALRMFDQAINNQEGYNDIDVFYHNRSETYKILGHYKAALKDAQKALDLAEYRPKAYMCNLKIIYEKLGYQKSLKELARDLDLEPQSLSQYCTRSNVAIPILATEMDDPFSGRFPLLKKLFPWTR